jgi:predicted MFS family arabinose efflux permease
MLTDNGQPRDPPSVPDTLQVPVDPPTVSEDAGPGKARAHRRASGRPLIIIFVARTALNTAHRFIYPFLPTIARGLGISLPAASLLITLRLVAGMAAPFLGPIADRHSRRRVMEVALLAFTLASLLLASVNLFVTAALAFVLYGLAKVLYDPTIHAYLGDTVPYARRGRAIGFVEMSWSGAWLLGVPAAGFLIERYGWHAPWTALAGLGLLSFWLTRVGLPPGRRSAAPRGGELHLSSLLRSWRRLLRHRPIVVLLLTSLLITMALEVPFIVYGAWLETSFGLSLSTLGVASIVVGLAEAAAELGTTVFTDRLGKRRSVLIGLLGLAASLVVLPGLAQLGLVPAMVGLVLVMLAFEFAIVSLFPLATELAPEARATLLSLNVTAFSLGRIAGAASGGWLWQSGGEGIVLNALVGAACALLAAFLVARGLVEIEA